MLLTASVAMAVYNGERFLTQQLDSILSQLCGDDELVVSYDESSDTTLDILKSYSERDPRVRIVINDNPGIVGNFNNAISHCSKDVIFISDQDDVWVSGKREKVMQALNASSADLVIHDVVNIDAKGKVISDSAFARYDIKNGKFRNFAKPRYSGCCMAFPRSSERLIMPMPDTVINYDHWIGMVCEVYGKIFFLNEVLLQHRIHGENVTTNTRPLPVVIRQRLNLLGELRRRGKALR